MAAHAHASSAKGLRMVHLVDAMHALLTEQLKRMLTSHGLSFDSELCALWRGKCTMPSRHLPAAEGLGLRLCKACPSGAWASVQNAVISRAYAPE